jgi:hypothetical protein
MTKKKKETKFVHGTSIMNIKGYDYWLACTTDENERITISLTEIFKLFDKYDFLVVKYGDRWRVTGFEEKVEGGLFG